MICLDEPTALHYENAAMIEDLPASQQVSICTDNGTQISLAAKEFTAEFLNLHEKLGWLKEELTPKKYDLPNLDSSVEESSVNRPVMASPIFVTFLQFFLGSTGGNMSEAEYAKKILVHRDRLNEFGNCFEDFQNLTSGRTVVEAVMLTWDQLLGMIDERNHEKFRRRCQKFIDLGATVTDGASEPFVDNPSTSGGTVGDDLFQRYINKTVTTMFQLSRTIQMTLESVKHLPNDLLTENETAQKIGAKLKETVQNLNTKVTAGWAKINQHFENAKRKWFIHSCNGHHCKRRRHGHGTTNRRPDLVRESADEVRDKRSEFEQKPKQEFANKPNHKQTESSSCGATGRHQKYEEFWNRNQFDPDDFLQEGFFEGNQREWRKYQKRLRKINGRLQRLNEEIFLSMDDDDVEDVYEDMEDFADDIEERKVPEKLRTWLTCQLRWWKSRIHRKHRDEDLVKGCGRQLMHWQMRALCKPDSGGSSYGCPSKSDESVIPSQGYDGPPTAKDARKNFKKSRHSWFGRSIEEPVEVPRDSTRRDEATPQPPPVMENPADMLPENETTTLEMENGNNGHSSGAWYFRRRQAFDGRFADSSWYFERMEDREASRHDSDWYLKAIHRAALQGHADQIPDDAVDHLGNGEDDGKE